MNEENSVRLRQYGNSQRVIEAQALKSSNRDTRALAEHGKRQQLDVCVRVAPRLGADRIVEKLRAHSCHCTLLDFALIIRSPCQVSSLRSHEYGILLIRTSIISTGFENGGPVSLIYGLLLSFAGTLALCLSLAEMASIAPISSAQYHFVAMLTPPEASKSLSWVAGKSHFI